MIFLIGYLHEARISMTITKEEYLSKIQKEEVIEPKVKKIEDIYGYKLPVLVKKIVSFSNDVLYLNNGIRILSYNEIKNAGSDTKIDFPGKGIIPIAYIGNDDFIVYSFIKRCYAKFNVIDEGIVFKTSDNLEDLL